MRLHHIVLMVIICSSCIACSSLPDLEQRTPSYSVPVSKTQSTRLGQFLSPILRNSPESTGIMPLAEAEPSLDARLILINNAQVALDIQYYIWRDDKSGQRLTKAIFQAANRGVKVRLLLDDLHSRDIDESLQRLNGHPSIEVRLFNPFLPRSSRVLGFITDFPRANRRMHNKSLTVDNQATIVGGRNIGDDYFYRSDGILFADLDVLAIGDVVAKVSSDFDAFWNSNSAYPYELISQSTTPSDSTLFIHQTNIDQPSDLSELLNSDSIIWAETQIVSDSPLKALGKAEPDQLIVHALRKIIGQPKKQLLLVSPYFVPTLSGVKALESIAENGVSISVLTNSFAATDVAVVHSGYAKWRKRLLEADIRLFEMRPGTVGTDTTIYESVETSFSSSASSLHAKTFAVDGQRVFVGSFNFDPRSARLNTELGFVIESPEIASTMADVFIEEVPYSAYEVRLAPSGSLYWLEQNGSHHRRYDTEPGTTWFQRFSAGFFSLLPIDWLL